jgi:hypothetical protein
MAFTRGEIASMCHDRAETHSLFADQRNKYFSRWTHWSPHHVRWHRDLHQAYTKLASEALDDGEHALRRMALMDGCVLQSLAVEIPLEQCASIVHIPRLNAEKLNKDSRDMTEVLLI